MPCPVSVLERGSVCLALYPYTRGFPLERALRAVEDEVTAQLERLDSIEEVAARVALDNQPPEILVSMKLRRVLLLNNGTNPARQDVIVARINSVTERKSQRERWYRRLKEGTHPAHLLIGDRLEHGTDGEEAYVDLLALSSIRTTSILRKAGQLDQDEMRDVSERLVQTLELDLTRYFAALAQPEEEELAR